jgi:hypothetical protein
MFIKCKSYKRTSQDVKYGVYFIQDLCPHQSNAACLGHCNDQACIRVH